jgi:ABC-type glycerol-3-phosphate transport system permease component
VGSLSRMPSFRLAPYYAILVVLSAFTIGLLAWVVLGSLKSNIEIFGSPWSLPSDPIANGIKNYSTAWTRAHLGDYFVNSVVVTGASVAMIIAVAAPAAYVLARMTFIGRSALSYYLIAGLGVPHVLIVVPLIVLMTDLHLVNTLPGLILVYSAVNVPFAVLLLTGFFRSLPRELEDAAAIDGASRFTTFFRVMLPIARPGIGTAAVFAFVEVWNEFFLALLLIRDGELRTMPLGIYSLKTAMTMTANWAGLYAGVIILILPATIVFLLLADRMMRGLSLSAGK